MLHARQALSLAVRVTWSAEHLCRSPWKLQAEGLTCMLPGPSKTVQWGGAAFTVHLREVCLHSSASLISLLRIPECSCSWGCRLFKRFRKIICQQTVA